MYNEKFVMIIRDTPFNVEILPTNCGPAKLQLLHHATSFFHFFFFFARFKTYVNSIWYCRYGMSLFIAFTIVIERERKVTLEFLLSLLVIFVCIDYPITFISIAKFRLIRALLVNDRNVYMHSA